MHAERQMLERYLERGLRVSGVRLSFGEVAVLELAPKRTVLHTVDQLGQMRAHSLRGGRKLSLPRDQPTLHRIVLRQEAGRWLISSVKAL